MTLQNGPTNTEPVPGANPRFRRTPKWQSKTFLLSVASRAGFIITPVFALIAYLVGKRDPMLPAFIIAIGNGISGFLNGQGVAAAREVGISAGAQASQMGPPPVMVGKGPDQTIPQGGD